MRNRILALVMVLPSGVMRGEGGDKAALRCCSAMSSAAVPVNRLHLGVTRLVGKCTSSMVAFAAGRPVASRCAHHHVDGCCRVCL